MINHIAIVGGGTSGWLTAASLSHKIKNVKVTLIDKDQSNSVGVGEATLVKYKVSLMNNLRLKTHIDYLNEKGFC
jgi:2-polyprenyl-6-methoxyphenol hydroxylase-like FAD-dependent oxidoreductase